MHLLLAVVGKVVYPLFVERETDTTGARQGSPAGALQQLDPPRTRSIFGARTSWFYGCLILYSIEIFQARDRYSTCVVHGFAAVYFNNRTAAILRAPKICRVPGGCRFCIAPTGERYLAQINSGKTIKYGRPGSVACLVDLNVVLRPLVSLA